MRPIFTRSSQSQRVKLSPKVEEAFINLQDRFPHHHRSTLNFRDLRDLRDFKIALFDVLPILLGYLPISFAYGVLAANSGIPTFMTFGMSLLIYAGSSQFVAVGLLASGASPLSVFLAIVMVNARYFLMSTAMLSPLRHWPKVKRFLFSLQMTDETFALQCSKADTHKISMSQAFWANGLSHVVWLSGTGLGYFAKSLISSPEKMGLDFALPAMFIALIVLQLDTLFKLSASLIAIGLMILIYLTPLRNWAVLISAVITSVFIGIGETWRPRN